MVNIITVKYEYVNLGLYQVKVPSTC
jgi:hypothetical protein